MSTPPPSPSPDEPKLPFFSFGFAAAAGFIAIGGNAAGTFLAIGGNTIAPISIGAINAVGIVSFSFVNAIGPFAIGAVNSMGFTDLRVGVASMLAISLVSLVRVGWQRWTRPFVVETPLDPPPGATSTSLASLEPYKHPFDAWVRATEVHVETFALVVVDGDARRTVTADASVVRIVDAHIEAREGANDTRALLHVTSRLREVPDAEYRSAGAEVELVVIDVRFPEPAPKADAKLFGPKGNRDAMRALGAGVMAAILLIVLFR